MNTNSELFSSVWNHFNQNDWARETFSSNDPTWFYFTTPSVRQLFLVFGFVCVYSTHHSVVQDSKYNENTRDIVIKSCCCRRSWGIWSRRPWRPPRRRARTAWWPVCGRAFRAPALPAPPRHSSTPSCASPASDQQHVNKTDVLLPLVHTSPFGSQSERETLDRIQFSSEWEYLKETLWTTLVQHETCSCQR